MVYRLLLLLFLVLEASWLWCRLPSVYLVGKGRGRGGYDPSAPMLELTAEKFHGSFDDERDTDGICEDEISGSEAEAVSSSFNEDEDALPDYWPTPRSADGGTPRTAALRMARQNLSRSKQTMLPLPSQLPPPAGREQVVLPRGGGGVSTRLHRTPPSAWHASSSIERSPHHVSPSARLVTSSPFMSGAARAKGDGDDSQAAAISAASTGKLRGPPKVRCTPSLPGSIVTPEQYRSQLRRVQQGLVAHAPSATAVSGMAVEREIAAVVMQRAIRRRAAIQRAHASGSGVVLVPTRALTTGARFEVVAPARPRTDPTVASPPPLVSPVAPRPLSAARGPTAAPSVIHTPQTAQPTPSRSGTLPAAEATPPLPTTAAAPPKVSPPAPNDDGSSLRQDDTAAISFHPGFCCLGVLLPLTLVLITTAELEIFKPYIDAHLGPEPSPPPPSAPPLPPALPLLPNGDYDCTINMPVLGTDIVALNLIALCVMMLLCAVLVQCAARVYLTTPRIMHWSTNRLPKLLAPWIRRAEELVLVWSRYVDARPKQPRVNSAFDA